MSYVRNGLEIDVNMIMCDAVKGNYSRLCVCVCEIQKQITATNLCMARFQST